MVSGAKAKLLMSVTPEALLNLTLTHLYRLVSGMAPHPSSSAHPLFK